MSNVKREHGCSESGKTLKEGYSRNPDTQKDLNSKTCLPPEIPKSIQQNLIKNKIINTQDNKSTGN